MASIANLVGWTMCVQLALEYDANTLQRAKNHIVCVQKKCSRLLSASQLIIWADIIAGRNLIETDFSWLDCWEPAKIYPIKQLAALSLNWLRM